MAKKNWEFRQVLNCLAYFALIFAAIALVVGQLIPSARVFLMPIASFLAFCVASVSAFHWARSKRNAAWMIIFVICAIVVLVMLALAALGR